MADPWKEDFAALDERVRQDLHPIAATRALRHQETKSMRFSFKQRPVFAVLVVLAVLLVAPLAYAVVNHVFLNLDINKSAPEIEQDLKSQLDQAGVQGAEVHAEKSDDGKLKVKISAANTNSDIQVVTPPRVLGDQRTVRVALGFKPSDDQLKKVTDATTSEDVQSLLDGDLTGGDLAAALKQELANHGIDADVAVDGTAIAVTVKAVQ